MSRGHHPILYLLDGTKQSVDPGTTLKDLQRVFGESCYLVDHNTSLAHYREDYVLTGRSYDLREGMLPF
jgi:hypothetical protein